MKFKTGTLVDFKFDEIKEQIRTSSPTTAVYVGSDSKCFTKNRVKYVAYATAIVLHIDSRAGGRLFKAIEVQRDYGSLRQRLMYEVHLASTAALEIVDVIDKRPFQVHLDLNPNPAHKSSICVKEATGYILGTMGFKPILKPNAFVASAISDRHAVRTATRLG